MTDKIKILVIDDEEGICELFKSAFEGVYQVITSNQINEGKEKAKEGKPELIFLDNNLPDGRGIEIIKELQLLAPHTPLVMITGQGDVELAERAMDLGAHDYITKPFDVNKLKHRVEQIFKIHKLEQEIAELKGGTS